MKKNRLHILSLIVAIFANIFSPLLAQNNERKIERIISLSPPMTEQTFLLGSGDKIIACTTFCTKPPETEKIEKIGSLLDVNIEKIFSLNPDIILASSHNKPATLEKLRSLKLNVFIQNVPHNFESLFANFAALGKVLGKQELAEEIANNSKNKINAIKEICSKSSQKPKVLYQLGSKPLYLVGNDFFISDFIKYSNSENILSDKISGVFNREFVISENPDFIFITDMGITSQDEISEWKKFQSINAVKNDKIFILDSYALCSPNPLNLPHTLAKIAIILHPELKIQIQKIANE